MTCESPYTPVYITPPKNVRSLTVPKTPIPNPFIVNGTFFSPAYIRPPKIHEAYAQVLCMYPLLSAQAYFSPVHKSHLKTQKDLNPKNSYINPLPESMAPPVDPYK